MKIGEFQSIANVGSSPPKISSPEGSQEKSFGQVLKQSVQDVNRMMGEADRMIEGLALGEKKDLHQTMIAIEKASVSFQLMMQVRNKIVSAYEEVARMQV
jgi:flagellar hook-basal body complex protein FliE